MKIPGQLQTARNVIDDRGESNAVALGEADAQFCIPAESVPELVCVVEDGLVTYINNSGVRCIGAASADEIVGSRFSDLLAPEYRELLSGDLGQWASEPEPLPIKMQRIDGSYAEIELSISPWPGSTDGRLIVTARDITERKRSAIALLERERRINAIMNNVVDGIIAIDVTGRIEEANNAALAMFGFTDQELAGQSVEILMTAEDAKNHGGHIEKYLRTGKGPVLEGRVRGLVGRRKDGSTFPMELAVREMKHGIDRSFIGAIRDVTVRQRREAALKESEARLRNIVDNAPIQIALCDDNRNIILVNKAYSEAHNIDPEEAKGRNPSDFYPADVLAEIVSEHNEVLRTGKERKQQRQFKHNGESHYEDVIRFPIPGPENAPMGVGVMISDVTEQIGLEERLRESEKLSALGQLAGGIAHDFNNLLMVIGGYADRAIDSPDDRERVKRALSEIVLAANKATALTKQLLSFSRRQVLDTKVVRVATLLGELNSLLSPLLGETVNLAVSIEDRHACVEIDGAQLSQALVNLSINARDAMPGGGALNIKFEVAEPSEAVQRRYPDRAAGVYGKFSIEDDGMGMDSETVAHIFEPFFTTKEQGKGTGLGLAMVYGFVHKSDGMIDVISSPGEGTAVNIYLPLTDIAPEAPADVDKNSEQGKGETILMAEDDDALRRLSQETLEELGYKVLSAGDGLDALEMEGEYEGEIDLMLSDVVMPRMGGFELIRAVRETRPNIKTILMSGYPSRGDIKAFDIPDDVMLLQKPVTSKVLARKIRDVLDDKPANKNGQD